MSLHQMGDVHGYQCDECGSYRIRFARPGDQGLFENDTLVCRDCGAGGTEQSFLPREPIETTEEDDMYVVAEQPRYTTNKLLVYGPATFMQCQSYMRTGRGELMAIPFNSLDTFTWEPTSRESLLAHGASLPEQKE